MAQVRNNTLYVPSTHPAVVQTLITTQEHHKAACFERDPYGQQVESQRILSTPKARGGVRPGRGRMAEAPRDREEGH
jgi:hypothetical protein